MQDRDITAQIWGITYTQIWTKKKRGLPRFENISNTLRSIMNCRFLAQLFRWQ